MKEKKRLGDILREQGKITEDQIQQTLLVQKESGGRLGGNLVRLGICSADEVTDAVIVQFTLSEIDSLSGYLIDISTIMIVPYHLAKKNSIIPIELDGQILLMASSKPISSELSGEISRTTGFTPKSFILPEKIIQDSISEYYAPVLALKRSWLDDDRLRSGILISLLILLLLLLVCNFKKHFNSYVDPRTAKKSTSIISEMAPIDFLTEDEMDVIQLTQMVEDAHTSLEGEIFLKEGRDVRKQEDVIRILRMNYDDLIRLYNRYLRRYPNIKGKVIFDVTINAAGKVVKVIIISSEISDNVFVQSAIDVIKEWRFQAIEVDVDAVLRFPFDFKIAQ